MTAALEISQLSYRVPRLEILKDLDLAVMTQQRYAIAGVNGAGKSTLIKLVLDLIRPEPGGSILGAHTAESTALSKDLKKRGFSFVGPTTSSAFMQAMGIVNDHLPDCHAWETVARARATFVRPS